MDLSIDTKARKVMLDGKPLDTVTETSFLWNTNGVSSVTLTKCGTYIGKINLNGRMYGLRCPHCGGNVDTTAPRE